MQNRIFIMAQNDRSFWSWLFKHGIQRNTNILYLHGPQQIRGLKNITVVKVGAYWEGPFFLTPGAADELKYLESIGRARVMTGEDFLKENHGTFTGQSDQ